MHFLMGRQRHRQPHGHPADNCSCRGAVLGQVFPAELFQHTDGCGVGCHERI